MMRMLSWLPRPPVLNINVLLHLSCKHDDKSSLAPFPPPVLNYEITKWVPTVELTVQFFRRPENVNDLLPVRFYNEFMENGMSSPLGEVYDSNGNLLAVSRQLCMSMTG